MDPKAKKYKQISLPIPLMERVDKYLAEHKTDGFVSLPEYIRQAIREKLDRNEK